MVSSTRPLLRRIGGGMIVLTLALLLAACTGRSGQSDDMSGGMSSNPVKQVVPTMSTMPTATIGATASATMTKSALTKTYTGSGYTIHYPENWKVTTSSAGTAFTDPSGSYNLTIGSAADPNGTKSADQLAESGIEGAKTDLKEVQKVALPQSTMVSGQEWSQRSITGNSTLDGKSSEVEAVVLANNYPAHASTTRGNVIVYVAIKSQFDQAQKEYFQPMLDSFKYTV